MAIPTGLTIVFFELVADLSQKLTQEGDQEKSLP